MGSMQKGTIFFKGIGFLRILVIVRYPETNVPWISKTDYTVFFRLAGTLSSDYTALKHFLYHHRHTNFLEIYSSVVSWP